MGDAADVRSARRRRCRARSAQLAVLGWRPAAVCLAPRQGGPHWPRWPADRTAARRRAAARPVAGRMADRARGMARGAGASRFSRHDARVGRPRRTRGRDRAAASGDYAGPRDASRSRGPIISSACACIARRGFRGSRTSAIRGPTARTRRRASARPGGGWKRTSSAKRRPSCSSPSETADLVMTKYPRRVAAQSLRRAARLRAWPPGRVHRASRSVPADAHRLHRPVLRGHPDTARAVAGFGAVDVARHRSRARSKCRSSGPHTEEFAADASGPRRLGSLVRFAVASPPAEAASAAADADVLLVIDAPSRGPSPFLPSKLIDYLPLRKPILGVTPETGAIGRPAAATRLSRGAAGRCRRDRAGARRISSRRWRSGTLGVGADVRSRRRGVRDQPDDGPASRRADSCLRARDNRAAATDELPRAARDRCVLPGDQRGRRPVPCRRRGASRPRRLLGAHDGGRSRARRHRDRSTG